MGPRSYERGNGKLCKRPRGPPGLQWGRVLMNAEIDFRSRLQPDPPGLQWGRVLMNAEI